MDPRFKNCLNHTPSTNERLEKEREAYVEKIKYAFCVGFLVIPTLYEIYWKWESDQTWLLVLTCVFFSIFLIRIAFLMGKLRLLRQLGVEHPVRMREPLIPNPHLHAYLSMKEARRNGWKFFDQVGRLDAEIIPRFAHDGKNWFEYQGLAADPNQMVPDDHRMFSNFVFVKLKQSPVCADNLQLVQEETPSSTLAAQA